MCVMSEKLMHHLGLEVSSPSEIKDKMANNNKRAKFVEIVEDIKVTMFGIEVPIDMYVLPITRRAIQSF